MGKDKLIYVLLIRSNTMVSRIIHKLTKEQYTHASLGFMNSGLELYSFARKYASLPLPAGLVQERIDEGLMGKSELAPCALYSIRLTEEEHSRLHGDLSMMWLNQKQWRYSLIGTILCGLKLQLNRRNKLFCSQFVAIMLGNSGAVRLTKPPHLYHPADFAGIPESELCYKGTLAGLREFFLQSQNGAACPAMVRQGI